MIKEVDSSLGEAGGLLPLWVCEARGLGRVPGPQAGVETRDREMGLAGRQWLLPLWGQLTSVLHSEDSMVFSKVQIWLWLPYCFKILLSFHRSQVRDQTPCSLAPAETPGDLRTSGPIAPSQGTPRT